MKTEAEIRKDLAYFTGTEHYHRTHPNMLLTDGTKYLVDECGAYWLADVVWSYLSHVDDRFAVVSLTVSDDSSAQFQMTDDLPANVVYASQHIEYTDFPLKEIKLYIINDGDFWVLLLQSEY